MADYNQNIKVTADTKQAEKELSKLDQALKGLSKFTLDIGKGAATSGVKLAQRNLQDYGRTLGAIDRQLGGFGKRLGEIAKAFDFGGKTVVGIAGINALGSAMSGLPRIFGPAASALRGFGGAVEGLTSPIQAVTAAIQAMGPGGMAAAGGIAAATAAFMAFSPAVKKVVTGLDNLVLGGKIQSAFGGIKGKVEETKQSFFGLNTTIEATVQGLNELAEGMSLRQLNKQVSSLTKEMESYHSSTVEAWTAAQQLVTAKKAEVAEQKALNDLVRQAKGLRSESVEAKATNTYNVTQRRNSFLKEQADDAERLQRVLGAMGGQGSNPFGMSQDQIQGGALAKYTSDMERLQEVLGKMETRGASNPFGITAKQIETADHNTKKWKSDLEQVNAELADLVSLHKALGQMEGQGANPFGIEQDQIQEAYQMRFKEEKAYEDLRGDTIRHALQMELDSIDEVLNARTKANAAALRDFDKRLEQRTSKSGGAGKGKGGFDLANASVSGAFPLLFGGGPGAVLGGFAGGGISGLAGNPMFGIVTSALGTMLDAYVKSLTDLASSLKSPTDALTAMEAAGLKVSDSLRYTVEQLSASGRGYEAQARVIAELNRRLGTDTTQSLFALNAEQKKLGERWGELTAELQSQIIPALTGTVVLFNQLGELLSGFSKLGLPKWLVDFMTVTNPGFALSRFQFESAQKRGIQAGKGAKPPALDLKGQEAEIDRRVQSAAQERQLRQQGIDLERSAVDLRLNAEEAVYGLRRKAADIERSSIELRQSIEDAIFSKRQELARAESDNLRRQAQLSIERLDLSLSQIGKGDPTSKFEGSQLVTAAREYLRVRGEGEADLAQKERELKLKLADIDRDGTKFRLDVSKKSADLQLQASDYQRDVAKTYLQLTRSAEDYKVKVAEYQYAMAQRTYELAKQTGDLQQVQAAAGPLTPGATGAFGPLSRVIGGHESYGGNYGAFNRGGSNNGHTAHGSGIDPNLVNMTIAEIQRRQLAPGVPRNQQLHAVGKYQIIGGTLRGLLNGSYGATGVTPDMKFTPEVQEALGAALARNRIVPGNVGATMRGLRSEWIGLQYAPDTQLRPAVEQLMSGKGGAPVPVVVTGATGATAATAPTAPTAPGIPALPAAPKLADISGVLNVYTALVDKSKAIEISSMELVKRWKELGDQKAAVELQQRFDELLRKALGPMNEIVEDQKNSAAYQREYGALLADGVLPALAEQLAKIKQTYTQAKELLDYEVLSVEAAIAEAKARGQITTELEKELALLKEKLGLLDKQKEKAEEGAKKAQSPGERLQGAYDKVKGELNELTDPVNQVIAGANAIGSAFGQAFKDVASGAKTAQQALADAFQGIANHFLDMASQMIAKWIEMQIIGLAMNFFSSAAGGFGGFSGAGPVAMPGAGVGGGSSMFMPGAPSFMATGGSISATSPTIVGERGPELFVPGQSGGITNHQNLRSLMASDGGGGKDGGGTTMNMSFETTQFMDREWVDRQQLETAMATASKQGAAQGERRALDRLRQSPRTRRSVGI